MTDTQRLKSDVHDVQGNRDGGSLAKLDASLAQPVEGLCDVVCFDDRQRLGFAAEVFGCTSDGVVVTDGSGRIVDVNPAFCRITGYQRGEVLGHNPRMMRSARHDRGFYESMWHALKTRGRWQGEVWDRRKSGESYLKRLTITAIRDSAGEQAHFVGVFSEVQRGSDSDPAGTNSNLDALTGLPNRVRFRERLRQAMTQSGVQALQVAVVLVGLDGFRRVQEIFGNAAGDELLLQIGRRLSCILQETDIVARLGRDEFAILLPEVHDVSAAAVVVRRVLDAVAEEVVIEGKRVGPTASAGIALYPEDAGDIENLLRCADTAMFHAKRSGRGRYAFYSQEMRARAARHASLESELRRAVERGQLVLHYQPRVDTATGEVCAVEALVRWRHPRFGLMPPGRFIALAEQTRLIGPIGAWVLREACYQVNRWNERGLPRIRVSVNLSAQQFNRASLVREIRDVLSSTGLPPDQLELELTESLAMRDPELSAVMLHELRTLGVRSAIDDFGTGYSSLSYLKRLPIDALKIDRSFVRDVVDDPDDANIARAIIGLGHNLRLRVVAEGVETDEQLHVLRSTGCDEVQGFLVGRPMEPARLQELLSKGRVLLPLAAQEVVGEAR